MKVGDEICPSLRVPVRDSVALSIAGRATVDVRFLAENVIWNSVYNTVPNPRDMKASAKKLIIQKP